MKKFYTIFIASLLIFIFSSQSFAQFHLKVGPVIGLNFNFGSGSDVPNSTNGVGFVGGGKLDMDFTPVVGLIANVYFYDGRSVSFTQNQINVSESIGYFSIEPLLKFSLPRSGFYFIIGPAIGINIQATYTASANGQSATGTIPNVNSILVSVKGGAGMEIPIAHNILIVPEATFAYGFTKFTSDSNGKILTIQVTGTVLFDLL